MDPSKKAILNYDKLGQVLWFDWLRGSPASNFFVLTNLAIQILNFDEEKMKFKKVSAHKQKINNCWFEPKRQLLAINFDSDISVIAIYDMFRLDQVSWRNPTYRVTLDLTDGSGATTKIQTQLDNHYAFLESRLDRPVSVHGIY